MTDMYFKQVLHDDCGCSSYIVGGRPTNEVAVIDAPSDLAEIREVLALRGLTVRWVIDTHIHADHISGGRILAAETGARYAMHASADLVAPFEPLHDGQELPLGQVSLRVLHTPGHRPESITLLVTNHARSDAVSMAITGDTLLVGDVGRPDFGGADGARELYGSVHKLLELDDWVEVFPAHFDGPCGKGMCGRPSTTIGFERRFNPLLQVGIEAFVTDCTTDVPAKPLNMGAIVAHNRGERDAPWAMVQGEAPVTEVAASASMAWVQAHDARIVDVREDWEYGRGHIPGAISIPQSQLADRLEELGKPGSAVLVVCAGGSRSVRAARFLQQQGWQQVCSLSGGTTAYAATHPLAITPA